MTNQPTEQGLREALELAMCGQSMTDTGLPPLEYRNAFALHLDATRVSMEDEEIAEGWVDPYYGLHSEVVRLLRKYVLRETPLDPDEEAVRRILARGLKYDGARDCYERDIPSAVAQFKKETRRG